MVNATDATTPNASVEIENEKLCSRHMALGCSGLDLSPLKVS